MGHLFKILRKHVVNDLTASRNRARGVFICEHVSALDIDVKRNITDQGISIEIF